MTSIKIRPVRSSGVARRFSQGEYAMTYRQRALTLASTAICATLAMAAQAPAWADAAAAAAPDNTVQEVIVTAEKKSELASKTPVAISAFNS